jgi:hypothetical protein
MEPYPAGTIVDYHGSHSHGRYVVTGHEVPRDGTPDPDVHYPDGVAYVIWREGVLRKFGEPHVLSTSGAARLHHPPPSE